MQKKIDDAKPAGYDETADLANPANSDPFGIQTSMEEDARRNTLPLKTNKPVYNAQIDSRVNQGIERAKNDLGDGGDGCCAPGGNCSLF